MIALHSSGASLVLEQREGAPPVWRHLGGKIEPAGAPELATTRGWTTFSMNEDVPFDILPVANSGGFFSPAVKVADTEGAELTLSFDECTIDQSDAALVIKCRDGKNRLAVEMTIEATDGGFVFYTQLSNLGDKPVVVDRLSSATLPLSASSAHILSWRGRHNAEWVACREPMPEHGWTREVRRGITGHGGPCGAYILASDAGYDSGLVLAAQLAWSGDTRLLIERSEDGFWTMQADSLLARNEVRLDPGETHKAPSLLLSISESGRNGAMHNMHRLIRSSISWPDAAMPPRPVHMNSWEACYFSHDEQRIVELGKRAAAIGAERFVLDDGWFKGRNDDNAGLGDWVADPKKYPEGLGPVAEKVRDLGLEFGLWVEPEMVNPDSDLYRAHPDWVLALPDRNQPTARNQLVLDMRRSDVRDYLFERLDALLKAAPISYLKWDHNRDHSPSGGAAQTAGSYELLGRLRAAHPDVEIESCAGGGGRIDAGIVNYVHRFWTSDNIDALARVDMQRGFLAFMPPEVMGAHVGASPSHATGRAQSLAFRAAIACQGHFGIELDPATLSESEHAELSDWIEFYKDWRHLIHGGKTWLGEMQDGLVWQAQGHDEEVLAWVIRKDHFATRHAPPVPLPFAGRHDWEVRIVRTAVSHGVLTPKAAPFFHQLKESSQRLSGSWLAKSGLPVPALPAESALIFHLKAVR